MGLKVGDWAEQIQPAPFVGRVMEVRNDPNDTDHTIVVLEAPDGTQGVFDYRGPNGAQVKPRLDLDAA